VRLRKEIWSKNKVGDKYYVVRKGVVPSICQSWEDCSKMVTHFKDA
jgi:viroplasmin and RNaseH domain-containing protein